MFIVFAANLRHTVKYIYYEKIKYNSRTGIIKRGYRF